MNGKLLGSAAWSAMFGVLGAFTSGTAAAQDIVALSETSTEEIVVVGVRGSLARALDQKRRSEAIVDGISAEDIADFPDLNIADSLQRIPGVSVERSLGEARSIAVRGLASEFTRVTINGQNVVAGTSGREVDFNMFASELFNSVEVRKSHSASLVEGGLAGTVDLRTARPFDFRGPVFALSASAVGNDLAEGYRPRVSALASGTFADGTIGLLGSFSYSELALRQDNVEGLRFIQTSIDANRDGALDTNGVEYPFIPRYVNENTDRERLGVTLAAQFRPSPTFEATIDIAYATVDDLRTRYSIDGFIEPVDIRTPLSPPTISANGLITGATLGGVTSRSENILTPQRDELFLLNADARWDIGDRLTLSGKAGFSRAERGTEEFRSTWSSTGNFRFSLADPIFIGFEGVGRNILDSSIYNNHEARFINTDTTDEQTSGQLDLDWRIDAGWLETLSVGLRFEDRQKDTIQFDGRATSATNFTPFAVNLPVGNFFDGNGQATIIRSWPVADFGAVRASSTLVPSTLVIPQRLIATNTVEEETIGVYVQADIETTLFNRFDLRGDFGVRYVSTEQASTGFPTTVSRLTVDNEYSEALPSLNLALELRDDMLLRFSAARSLTRPTITDLTPGGTVAVGVPTATFGNPRLQPYTATNLDLSFEWYFADEGLLSVALYDKDIQGFITRVTAPETLGADVLGASDPRAGTSFQVSRPVNGQDAFVRGFEVSFQTPLTFLPIDGFGVLANYTYADSESTVSFAGQRITTLLRGQSESSYNLVGYFERGPISARLAYSWRDAYLDEIRTAQTERSNFIDDYGQLDGSFQYTLNEGLVFSVDALNLLGEEQYRYAQLTDRNVRYSETGRFFQVGLRAKF